MDYTGYVLTFWIALLLHLVLFLLRDSDKTRDRVAALERRVDELEGQ